jgi:hypothetical protein
MARYMLTRQGQSEELIPETELPLEKDLHDVLTQHPQLLPAEDLGLGSLLVVGRESSLTSGYADLVLVDDHGHVCLAEVKKAGNPDTRQVVAQLLDYAAALWGQSLAEFDQGVVTPYLQSLAENDGLSDLLSHLGDAFDDPESGDERAPQILQRVEQTLETGDFTLVVAAPEIPLGVQRVLEYLNARGQRFYALEVSYFKGPTECFVPRLVVMPAATGPSAASSTPPIDRETFIERLPVHVHGAAAEFLDRAQEMGADITWNTYGPSIRVERDKTKQVAYLETKRLGVTIQPSSDFPEEPFATAARRLIEINVGHAQSWWHTAAWTDMTEAQASNLLAVALDLIADLVPATPWTELQTTRTVSFDRNDHNVWIKSVPKLSDLQGSRLRGELTHAPSRDTATVELVPLKAGAAGWRPRIVSRPAAEIWPPNVYEGQYELRIEAIAAPAEAAS